MRPNFYNLSLRIIFGPIGLRLCEKKINKKIFEDSGGKKNDKKIYLFDLDVSQNFYNLSSRNIFWAVWAQVVRRNIKKYINKFSGTQDELSKF